ncbi:DUF1534 domain-containing protein [Pseudomonas cavernicola]|uniref:DUF1534 domain-containing protein n=1 Tax=Pseudomonas cavernicola TaxID=2320866 RepID=A0A418XBE6_9PSED|nr:DUF1534 domain-containing protein [Pseudomonas cavernicola]
MLIVPTLQRGNAARDAPRHKSRRWSVLRGIPTQSVGTIHLLQLCALQSSRIEKLAMCSKPLISAE